MWDNIWRILSMVATGGLLWLGIIFLLATLGELGLPATCPILESLLIFTGFQIARTGYIAASMPFLAVTCAGRLCGSSFAYHLSLSLGSILMNKVGTHVGITPERLDLVKQKLGSLTLPSIITARLTPGFTVVSSIVCGVSQIKYKNFFTATVVTTLAWETIFLTIGALGSRVSKFFGPQFYPIFLLTWITVMVIVGITIGYLTFRRIRNNN